jgi:hypothetical protein
VFLVGWEGKEPDLPGVLFRDRSVEEVGTSLARPHRHAVLVLVGPALDRLDPRTVAATFLRPGWRILACPAEFREEDQRWRIPGSIELRDRVHLLEALRCAVHDPPREAPPMSEVLGRALSRDPALRASYGALLSSPSLTVQGWARASGRNRHGLDDLWVGEAGIPPRHVIWMVRDAIVRRERRLGTPLRAIAAMTNYADVPTLLNAYRRRGIPLPALGSGG